MTPGDLADHLRRIDLATVLADTLAHESTALADTIREALSQPPGGTHAYPWRQSGDLQASIGSESDATEALIGSTSDVARYQEQGTAAIPPRPFLAPIAAAQSEAMADAVGKAVAGALAPAH